MAGELPKPVRPELVADDPLAFGQTRAFLLTEGAGEPVDAVTGLSATPAGTPAPAWGGSRFGPERVYVSASSQYDDLGQWPELDGAQRLTLWCVMRRASVGARMDLLRGTSLSNIFGIQLYSDGTAVWIVAGSSVDRGVVALADDDEHVFHLVYDGTQSTNASRLRGYIDGVPQSLSYTGTIPSSIPTVAASMRAGSYEGDGSMSNGALAAAGLYLRALPGDEVAEHAADPWRAYRTPELRRALLLSAVVVGTPATGYATNLRPADGARSTSYAGAVWVDWIALDTLNPFSDDAGDYSLAINGRAARPLGDPLDIGSGCRRTRWQGIERAGRTNTYAATGKTQDGTENVKTWSATARRVVVSEAMTDEFVPERRAQQALTDHVLAPFGAASADDVIADWATSRAAGIASGTGEITDYAAQDVRSGIFFSVDEMTDVVVIVPVKAPLLDLSANVGEHQRSPLPVGVNVEGRASSALPIGVAAGGTTSAPLVPLAVTLSKDQRLGLLALACAIGAYRGTDLPVGLRIDPVTAVAFLDIVVRSTVRQDAEAE